MTYKAKRPVPMLRDWDAFFVSNAFSVKVRREKILSELGGGPPARKELENKAKEFQNVSCKTSLINEKRCKKN